MGNPKLFLNSKNVLLMNCVTVPHGRQTMLQQQAYALAYI